MKLFHAPNSCSLGIRILLEEIGVAHEVVALDLRAGTHRSPEYLTVNPKGKVPALVRPDGSVLSEFQAIALWLARTHPEAELWPSDPEGEVRTLEMLEQLVATIHMRGFTLILVPGKFVADPAAQDALRSHGRAVAVEGLTRIALRLDNAAFLNGDRPGVTDAALFYLMHWALALDLDLPAPLHAFHTRMLARETVRRALDLAST